jgi:hypothetical protein
MPCGLIYMSQLFTVSKLFILVFSLGIFIVAAKPALAQSTIPQQQCADTEISTDFGCLPNSPIGFVEKFYQWGLGLIGLIGVLFLIIGGYHLLISRGDVEELQTGKSYIIYAIIGILLAIFGFVFIQIIASNVLHIPGFS